jgi:protein transport protein SEC20
MIDDLQGEKNRRELRRIVDDFNKKLARYGLFYPFVIQIMIISKYSLQRETRAALLASKQAIDARSKSNREDLLAFVSVLQEKQDSNEKSTYAYSINLLTVANKFEVTMSS